MSQNTERIALVFGANMALQQPYNYNQHTYNNININMERQMCTHLIQILI